MIYSLRLGGYYFFARRATEDGPAGVTVSKRKPLPAGDFGLTEYSWGPIALWFVDDDEFTADEREEAFEALAGEPTL